MNIYDNIIFKIALFSSSYLIILIIVSPIIDHSFTSLDEDINMKETNFQILGEIILHIICITIVWYYINLFARKHLESIFDVSIKVATKTAINVVSSVALIGLQKNLIEKLEYITLTHPFRLTDLYG
jgi:hypothetical protein